MKENQRMQIEEWFGDCVSPQDIAELYADLMHEIKSQMAFCLSSYKLKND